MTKSILKLSTGWSVLYDNTRVATEIPTVVQLDLSKTLPPPFKDLNALDVEWVGNKHNWTYQLDFSVPPQDDGDENDEHDGSALTDLVFQGLDTIAEVRLNGEKVLSSDNMFIEYRVNVNGLLQPKNKLEIVFDSARMRGLELVTKHSKHRFIASQTEMSRIPIRKAQYHWGWDWGPILLTCGPWKPVFLETYATRIDEAKITYELSDDLSSVDVTVFVTTSGRAPAHLKIYFDGEQYPAAKVQGRGAWISRLNKSPRLWWPRGYGSQSMYSVNIEIYDQSNRLLDKVAKKVGFRRAELIREKDDFGESFYFRINNVDVFAGGACWVPADSFLPRIDSARYRKWVALMASGNQIMTRVWGGGIYESDEFYDACDEFGILVWQDFAFACGNYPTHPEFVQSVEVEARQNIQRLRDHPSLVIWAGNNEDYQIMERWGLKYDFADKNPDSWLKTNFPARYFYEYLLPKIVAEESPGTIYRPSSPWGNGTSPVVKADPTVGDVHEWDVWHGDMKPYQLYPQMGGRFVSEFGMEAYPHVDTLERCITDPSERRHGSRTMEFRNKAIGHDHRIIKYVSENLRVCDDSFSSFIHLTQVMQADAMTYAYRGWRRQWGQAGKRQCGGALVWQLNDCWPTISWSVVDYYGTKKPAYYAIKRALEPLAVGVTRNFHDWTMRPRDAMWPRDTGHVDLRPGVVKYDVWVASSRTESVEVRVRVKFWSVRSGERVCDDIETTIVVAANGTTPVITGGALNNPDDPFVIHASLRVAGQYVGSDMSWPEPLKYLDMSDRGVVVREPSEGELRGTQNEALFAVSASKPTKGFVVREDASGAVTDLSDNGFDIMPGEERLVRRTVDGRYDFRKLDWTYIGDDGSSLRRR